MTAARVRRMRLAASRTAPAALRQLCATAAPRRAATMAAPLELTLQLSVDVEGVIAAARAAGEAILRIYDGDAEDWGVEHKADSSPLTRADKEANAVICGAPGSAPPRAEAEASRQAGWLAWRRTSPSCPRRTRLCRTTPARTTSTAGAWTRWTAPRRG